MWKLKTRDPMKLVFEINKWASWCHEELDFFVKRFSRIRVDDLLQERLCNFI